MQVLTKPRLQELVREIDPTEQLDEEVEELLLQIADDFIENTVNAACLLAKHRKVAKVEVKDVQLHLGKTNKIHLSNKIFVYTKNILLFFQSVTGICGYQASAPMN